MRILWVSPARLENGPRGVDSVNATTRYRMLSPAREIRRLGHEVEVFGLQHELAQALEALERVDVVVFTKLLADPGSRRFDAAIRQYGEVLRRARARGVRVVMDVNDHHFDHADFRGFYLECKPHTWVTSTPDLARLMLENGLGPASVIPDPYEGPAGNPAPPLPTRFPRLFRLLDRLSAPPGRGWRTSLLWFGHPAGLQTLAASVDKLVRGARDFPLHLHCLSSPGYGFEAWINRHNRSRGGALTMSFEPWSTEATWAALRSCDLVLLPADVASEKNRVKSANRLVETLRAGRFAVAQPMPAYVELGEYAYVGEALAEGIAWALRHPMKALRRIQGGQRCVAERFSPDAIARQWLNSLQSVQSGTSP